MQRIEKKNNQKSYFPYHTIKALRYVEYIQYLMGVGDLGYGYCNIMHKKKQWKYFFFFD